MLLILVIGISIVLVQAKTIELEKNNPTLTDSETSMLSIHDTYTTKNVPKNQ